MRFGYSWPLGHGRRAWISMGLGGWLLIGWLALPFLLCWWTLLLVVWLVHLLYVLGALAVRGLHRPRTGGRARGSG